MTVAGSPRLLRMVLWMAAVGLLIWAFTGAGFRNEEGALTGRFGLPLAAGVACAIAGYAVGRGATRAGLWAGIAMITQAATLQTIDAGPGVRYQHYRLPGRLLTESPEILVLLGGLLPVLAVGVLQLRPRLKEWLSLDLKRWQLLGIGLVFVLSSAALSREVPGYLGEIAFASLLQLVNLAAVLLAVAALSEETRGALGRMLDRLLGPPGQGPGAEPGGIDRFALVLAGAVTVTTALLCVLVYQRHPHIPDEVVYLYPARYFAAGMLTMTAPPVPAAFNIDLMTFDATRWYSPVPPGWPAMLALGALVKAPWLVNPVLAGLDILIAYALLREIYRKRTARLATALLAVSPWFLLMAMNFTTHTFSHTCALSAALAVARLKRTGMIRWAWVGGIAIGLVSLVRPLEGFATAGLLGLWALGVRGRSFRYAPVAVLALSSMLTGALQLPYNKYLTGDARKFPLIAYTDRYYGPGTNALGFGPDRGVNWPTSGLDPFPGHGLRDVLVNADLNTFSVNTELLGWATGSLLLIAVLIFSGALRRGDYLMLAVIAVIVGIHSFYWFSGGPDFGARYWYLIILPCIVLAARGAEFLDHRWADLRGREGIAIAAVLLLVVSTFVSFIPWRGADKYYHYRGMRPDVRELAQDRGFGRSLVLIRGKRHPDYASAAIYNPLDLGADAPVYAWDRNPEIRGQVLQAYADRPVWILDGPTLTRRGYAVVAGPLPSDSVAAAESRLAPYETPSPPEPRY